MTPSGRQNSPNPSSKNLRVQCPDSPWALFPIGLGPRFDRIDDAECQSTQNHDVPQSAVTIALRHQSENNQADYAEDYADDLMRPWSPHVRLVGAEGCEPQYRKEEHKIDANVAVPIAPEAGRHQTLVDGVEQP